jgi:hypothetical protein
MKRYLSGSEFIENGHIPIIIGKARELRAGDGSQGGDRQALL